MDSCERVDTSGIYEDILKREARGISVNELFDKKDRLNYDLTAAIRKFEFETGVKVKSVVINKDEFKVELDI